MKQDFLSIANQVYPNIQWNKKRTANGIYTQASLCAT